LKIIRSGLSIEYLYNESLRSIDWSRRWQIS